MSRCTGRWRRRRGGQRWSGSRARRLFRNMKNIMKRWWPMVGRLTAVALIGAALYGQDAKPVIDNERVTVWDVTWTKGQTNPARGHDLDAVIMWYTGDKAGQAFFSPKGDKRAEEGVAKSPGD